ncbi:MAG: aromatic ring-hydroxylating oxygenase subunit alpha [Nocardioidaceae bacterium]
MTAAHTAGAAHGVTSPVLPPQWLDPTGQDPDGLARALQPFGRSRMLPAAAYTSPEVLAWERRQLFAAGWTCLGREADLREAPSGQQATQRAVVVGDVAALLVWSGGRLRAFANTCSHRGHELLGAGDTSSRRSVVCPYHAWSYDLDGALRAAPGFHGVDGFHPDEHALVELAVECWHGWVFCSAASPAGHQRTAFAEHVGALESVIGPYAPERLVLADRHTYEVAANWKVVCENYHECYHCPMIHPELCAVSPPASGENYDLPGSWVGGRMELREGMATMSMTGESRSRPLPGAEPGIVEYVQLLPNLLISAHPDYVMTHRLVPQAPDRTWVECSWYLADPGDGSTPDSGYAVEFWDLTNRQDWAACESVQRGLASPHFSPGPFAPREDAVHRFVQRIGAAYLGAPL